MNSKGKNLKNEEKTWNSTWKYSKVVLRIFICMIFSILFIFGGNVKADTIEDSNKNENFIVMNKNNSANTVCNYITVLNKGDKAGIEIWDFYSAKNDFKLENFEIFLDSKEVIEISDVSSEYEYSGKISFYVSAKSNGIANIVIKKGDKKTLYTIIVEDNKNTVFNGYVIQKDNTFYVYDGSYGDKIKNETTGQIWKISVSSNEYKSEFYGTGTGQDDGKDDGKEDGKDDGDVTPGEDDRGKDYDELSPGDNLKYNESIPENEQENSNALKTDKTMAQKGLPQTGEQVIILLIIPILILIVYLAIRLKRKKYMK